MRTKRNWVCVTVLIWMSVTGWAISSELVPTRYSAFTVPYMQEAPVLDGSIDDRVWSQALKLPALIDHRSGELDSADTDVYIGFTDTHLLVGWKVYRGAEEGPMRLANHVPGRTLTGVWADDAVEIFIELEKGSGQAINFAGNALGAYSDGLATPGVDNSHSWNWEYAAQVTDEGWEGELAISFSDLGLKESPNEGLHLGFDFVRNNKSPNRYAAMLAWRDNWHDFSNFAWLKFDRDAPAVRFLQTGVIGEESVGVLLEINQFAQTQSELIVSQAIFQRKKKLAPFSFFKEVDSGIEDGGDDNQGITMADAGRQIQHLMAFFDRVWGERVEVKVRPDGRVPLNLAYSGAETNGYLIAYSILNQSGEVLTVGTLPVTRTDALEVSLTPYYLTAGMVVAKVNLHSEHLRNLTEILKIRVLRDGQPVEGTEVNVRLPHDEIEIDASAITAGVYTVETQAIGKKGEIIGKTEQTLVRPEDPWWSQVDYGKKAFVPPPWSPVEVDGSVVRVWGREYVWGDSLLPERMIATGEELFSGAPRIILKKNGQAHALTGKSTLLEHTEEHVLFAWESLMGTVPMTARIQVEFDGFMTVDLDVKAQGVEIEQLVVEFPFATEQASLYTLNRFLFDPQREEQRPNAAGLVKDGFRIGFNHAIWLGDTQRGFQWCAESYQHWYNRQRTEAIEVSHKGDTTWLKLHLIDHPVTPVEDLHYRWGLVATPTRPVTTEQRNVYYYQGQMPRNLPADQKAREGYQYHLSHAAAMGATHYNAFHWPQEHFGQPYLENQTTIKETQTMVQQARKHGMKVTVYSGWNAMTPAMSMWPFWGEEMIRTPGRFSYGGYGQCAGSTYQDYLANGLAWLVLELGVEGIYLDSTAGLQQCMDPRHSCGYVDSQTGRRVVTSPIWGLREMYKRMYKILHGEVIEAGMLYNHTGQPPMMAVESFSDIKHGGEGAYYSESLKDWFDLESYLARYHTKQYGFPPLEHTWQPSRPIAQNSVWGVAMLHDNSLKMYYHNVQQKRLHSQDYDGIRGIDWKMWYPRQWYQWEDSMWYPYHSNSEVLEISGEDVYASFHLNAQGQLLLYAMNMGETAREALFHLKTNILNLPDTLYAVDPVTNETLKIDGGCFTLEFSAERPRVLMIASEPLGAVKINLP